MRPAILPANEGRAEVRGVSRSGAAGARAGGMGGRGGSRPRAGGSKSILVRLRPILSATHFAAGQQVAGGPWIVGAATSSNGRGNRRGGSRWMQEVRSHVQYRLQHGGITAAPTAPAALLLS